MSYTVRACKITKGLSGSCGVPGDKSISHRALLLGSIAHGHSHVRGFLAGRDCLATLGVVRSLGVSVSLVGEDELHIEGAGMRGLVEPSDLLDCRNSGTTMRLAAGLLAGQDFTSFLGGTPQLLGRPMGRVVDPLREMGAKILGRRQDRYAPLAIRGSRLEGGCHRPEVASAQVKSAILLAGLYAKGETSVHEAGPSRDHTERMLTAMEAPIDTRGLEVRLEGPVESLSPVDMTVPGDPSSAAFLAVAATCAAGSRVSIRGVGINPTRHGLIEALIEMGAQIAIENVRTEGGEPVADLSIEASELRGATFEGERIVTMIDEIPVLALAATQATGTTIIKDAEELRVKETDRVATTIEELTKLGARVEALRDGLVVHGPTKLEGREVSGRGDHRIAMMLVVAGLLAEGETKICGSEVIPDSFPGFEHTLRELGATLIVE